ncbi:conserved hypothetical protein [Solidesulfovibrio fructosivorans JJ]]|uniref:Lipoprotein n=1 Tax=Solidesulfovibrio fructosivorans JJ] TaxID=596151 RepID=E1JWB5_SOLFR|nr:hypothetical protein [Solidesulfovibrio fructosivorans]EFL51212.1 conserved hypothetical protein [Solidesulfovibrio fructosivorans JJ]]
MPRIRPAFVLLLILALTACAPKPQTRHDAGKGKSTAKAAAPDSPSQPGHRVVLGEPLPPGAPITSAPAPQPPVAVPPAVQTPPPAPLAQAPLAPSPVAQAPVQQAASAQQPAAPAPAATPQGVPMFGEASPQTPGMAVPTGFGGLAWGVSVKSNPGLAVYEVDKGVDVVTCIWPQGPKDIAGAPIRDAFYEFFKDRFYHVWIDFDGMAAYKTALAGLTRDFGPPTAEKPDQYYHSWTIGDVNIYCVFHPAENAGDVSFFYQPLYEPMMAAKKAAAAKHTPRSRKK